MVCKEVIYVVPILFGVPRSSTTHAYWLCTCTQVAKQTVPNWTHETKEPVPKTFPIRAHPCWQKISLKKKVANWTNTRLLHCFHHRCDLSRYQVCKHISNYQSWWICYWEWTDFCTENWALAEMLQWSIHHGSSMPSFGGVEHCHTY